MENDLEAEVQRQYLIHRESLGVRESIKATAKLLCIPINEVCEVLGFDSDFLVTVL